MNEIEFSELWLEMNEWEFGQDHKQLGLIFDRMKDAISELFGECIHLNAQNKVLQERINRLTVERPSINVLRLEWDDSGMIPMSDGEYVNYDDFVQLFKYADDLVALGNLPCLPKDLENLREANGQLAQENFELKQKLGIKEL